MTYYDIAGEDDHAEAFSKHPLPSNCRIDVSIVNKSNFEICLGVSPVENQHIMYQSFSCHLYWAAGRSLSCVRVKIERGIFTHSLSHEFRDIIVSRVSK